MISRILCLCLAVLLLAGTACDKKDPPKEMDPTAKPETMKPKGLPKEGPPKEKDKDAQK